MEIASQGEAEKESQASHCSLTDEERETKSERWTKKLDKTKSKRENSRHNTGGQKAERQRCGDDRYREAKGESWGN